MLVRLPKDPIDRASSLVMRSQPNPKALLPAYLPPDLAEIVIEARQLRAEMYASMEDTTDRLRTISEDMDRRGVVLHLIDQDDEDSLVHHLDDARRACADASSATTRAEEIPGRKRR